MSGLTAKSEADFLSQVNGNTTTKTKAKKDQIQEINTFKLRKFRRNIDLGRVIFINTIEIDISYNLFSTIVAWVSRFYLWDLIKSLYQSTSLSVSLFVCLFVP